MKSTQTWCILPYVLVRIMESYIYLGLITGEHPDPDRAARVINALLPAAASRGHGGNGRS